MWPGSSSPVPVTWHAVHAWLADVPCSDVVPFVPTCDVCAPTVAAVVACTAATDESTCVFLGGAPVPFSFPPWQNVHSVCQLAWFEYVPDAYGPYTLGVAWHPLQLVLAIDPTGPKAM